ncbi:MBL fold metallo-hydrolase [soil metagenome]
MFCLLPTTALLCGFALPCESVRVSHTYAFNERRLWVTMFLQAQCLPQPAFICSAPLMQSATSLTYVGHATVLIEIDGVRVLTDPVLRQHVSGFIRRQIPLPTLQASNIDVVLISHLHYDHLDLPSLRLLGYHTHLVAPRGTAIFLHRQGFTNVTELVVGEQLVVGALRITATPARHSGARGWFGPKVESLGFLLHGQQTVYFAGDTDLFPQMREMANPLDIALLPVWGWGPTLGNGHMDPYRAAQALTLLKPRFAIPIHWGTLYPLGMRYLRPRLLQAPPHLFAYHAQVIAPEVQVRIVEPGHVLHFPT